MKERFILSLDQGTTSSRAILFNKAGKSVGSSQQDFEQIFPHPGWVEHNANEIWESQWNSTLGALKKANISSDQVAGIGITNQRETTLIWDRKTGMPIHNAIVWQDRRTAVIPLRKQVMWNVSRKKPGWFWMLTSPELK